MTRSASRRLLPGELPDSRHEVEQTGLFDDVVTRQFDWETQYTADEYLELLDTFSGRIAIRPARRTLVTDSPTALAVRRARTSTTEGHQ